VVKILRPFANLVVIWYFFSVLAFCITKKLAALVMDSDWNKMERKDKKVKLPETLPPTNFFHIAAKQWQHCQC
jgi:hypothetical protein